MLTKECAELVVSILTNTTDTLSSLQSKFSSSLNSRSRLIALNGLSFLLTDGLLDHKQQIVAIWLLYSEFISIPVDQSPFFDLFCNLYRLRRTQVNACSPQLYILLTGILNNKEFNAEKTGNSCVSEILGRDFDFEVRKEAVRVKDSQEKSVRISPVVVVKEENDEGCLSQNEMLVELLSNGMMYSGFGPRFPKNMQTISPIFPGELTDGFMNSWGDIPLLYDECVSINSRDTAISMIQRAASGKLRQAEVDSLSRELGKIPELAIEANLPLDKVEAMVDLTPMIAKDIFRILCLREPKLVEFLANTLITENLVVVAKEVLKSPDLPEGSLGTYISGQLSCIGKVRDAGTATKKTNLFCKLLEDVVRSGVVIPKQSLVDLLSFCMESDTAESQELVNLLSKDK